MLRSDINDIDTFNLKTGDKVRIPFELDYDEFKLWTVDDSCDKIVGESHIASIKDYKCKGTCRFTLRIKDFSSVSDPKQFAIYLDNSKIHTDYYGTASNMNDYLDNIVNHFDGNGWSVSRVGNLIDFEKTSCTDCGKDIEVRVGDYGVANTNSPSISSSDEGTETVQGETCYDIEIENMVSGNKFTINGITYTATPNDTVESMKKKIMRGGDLFCVPYGESITKSSQAGNRNIENTNFPAIYVEKSTSDSEYDYYKILVVDVREGNVFTVNSDQKIAGSSDGKSEIESFFNTHTKNGQQYYRVEKDQPISALALKGTRVVANITAPMFNFVQVSSVSTATKKKYIIQISSDVQKGNVFTLMGETYTAKEGDTNIDVAYALAGENSAVFTFYIGTGETLIKSASVGVRQNPLASVSPLGKVKCCDKSGEILEIDATAGSYIGEFKKSGQVVAYTPKFCVRENPNGEFVEFSDCDEWFGIRLPIFLKDGNPETFESIDESVDGTIYRNDTRIGFNRDFVTEAVGTSLHLFINKVLKSKEVKINGEKYTFIGEYSLPNHRMGVSDKRNATGKLKLNKVESIGCC